MPELFKTLIFIPAWNEAEVLPQVISEIQTEIPDTDILVIDDGSADKTREVAQKAGAQVVSFSENQGLRMAIAEGYSQAYERGYDYVGRVDADGQHPASELKRLLELVKRGQADVAVGSRFLREGREGKVNYKPSPERAVGIALLQLLLKIRLGQRMTDGTSGMYAVNREAMKLLADPYVCGAPEVEGLTRLKEAELKFVELPVEMRERQAGKSSFNFKRSLVLVGTIVSTVAFGKLVKQKRHPKPWYQKLNG